MKIIRILILFILLFPISNSFGAMVTSVQNETFADNGSRELRGIAFNEDGTKLFTSYQFKAEIEGVEEATNKLNEYNLSTPYDISTRTYAGNDERCELNSKSDGTGNGPSSDRVFDIEFSNDGMKVFVVEGIRNTSMDNDKVFRFDLTSPYDISTCFYVSETTNLDSMALQNGSNAGSRGSGDIPVNKKENRVQGMEFNETGTKLFLIFHGQSTFQASEGGGARPTRLLEYKLSTPYDITDLSLVTTAGIELEDEVSNPQTMRFSANGKRIFIVDHLGNANGREVHQVSLSNPYDTSSFTIDGRVSLADLDSDHTQPGGIAFSKSGLKMYVGDDGEQSIYEFDLVCPFNIIAGKCPPITENNNRTGMAIAQIEIAKRTIDHSTDSALNRLKWIRRNKDKQNLTNLNIDINFTNQRLASLTEIVKNVAAKKKAKDKEEDVFYWSEGSIAVGRIGDTSISSTKKIDTDAITFGVDKFTDENGIKGLAFRVGRNNVDIGNAGSNLDTDTFNITYYSTTPIEDDTKFLDTFIGIGGLRSDLLTVLDGKNLTANRKGKQIYGTIRIKDEIKKDNLTFIPSGRFDIGHTILGSYNESGNGGIDVENQHIRTKKIRASVAAVEDVLNEKYKLKRHGKIEYIMDLDQSSKFKYTYTGDSSVTFDDSLSSGALHSINSEIGIDIVLQDNFSVFLIYERNQALGSGHTDKIHIAIGYLPNKETNYAFNIQGSDDLRSEYILSKTINDFELDFKIINEDPFDISDIKQAFFNLRKVF